MRMALGLEYCGTAFHGWQKQAGLASVQESLEKALAMIAGERVSTFCAGRTDARVHAVMQVVHFDVTAKRPLSAWVRGVNSFLPDGVAVRWAREVGDDFHARYSAVGRRYGYWLINRPERLGLWSARAGWCHRPLNIEAMQQAAMDLPGEHDFSSFRGAGCQAKTPIKTLYRAQISSPQRGVLLFDFAASAFVLHMVRNLVGALVYVGMGRKPRDWLRQLLLQRDRTLAAPTFAAAGLYFHGPIYPSAFALPVPCDPNHLADLPTTAFVVP